MASAEPLKQMPPTPVGELPPKPPVGEAAPRGEKDEDQQTSFNPKNSAVIPLKIKIINNGTGPPRISISELSKCLEELNTSDLGVDCPNQEGNVVVLIPRAKIKTPASLVKTPLDTYPSIDSPPIEEVKSLLNLIRLIQYRKMKLDKIKSRGWVSPLLKGSKAYIQTKIKIHNGALRGLREALELLPLCALSNSCSECNSPIDLTENISVENILEYEISDSAETKYGREPFNQDEGS